MTPVEILPDLTQDDLIVLAGWLLDLPLSVMHTVSLAKHVHELGRFLEDLADLRRQT